MGFYFISRRLHTFVLTKFVLIHSDKRTELFIAACINSNINYLRWLHGPAFHTRLKRDDVFVASQPVKDNTRQLEDRNASWVLETMLMNNASCMCISRK